MTYLGMFTMYTQSKGTVAMMSKSAWIRTYFYTFDNIYMLPQLDLPHM